MALTAENLVKSYHARNVVDGVSLRVERGEVVGLLGPNGAGKTTTFYMIVGLEGPGSGAIRFNDIDITRWPIHRRARLGLGYLAQEASVFRKMTVEENIRSVLEVQGEPRQTQRERLDTLMAELQIDAIRHQYGFMLSGGERRRTEIARALAGGPDFILLDEPFAGVDPIAVADLQQIISHLKAKGLGILITDHNVRETLSITDRAYIMHQGKILVAGPSARIAQDALARKFYLGERFSL